MLVSVSHQHPFFRFVFTAACTISLDCMCATWIQLLLQAPWRQPQQRHAQWALWSSLSYFQLYGLCFPHDRYPFSSLRNSCSPSLYTNIPQIKFATIHPPPSKSFLFSSLILVRLSVTSLLSSHQSFFHHVQTIKIYIIWLQFRFLEI